MPPKKSTEKKAKKTVEAIKHDDASRKNIPTAEYQPVVPKELQSPIEIAYKRRNRDLDPHYPSPFFSWGYGSGFNIYRWGGEGDRVEILSKLSYIVSCIIKDIAVNHPRNKDLKDKYEYKGNPQLHMEMDQQVAYSLWLE